MKRTICLLGIGLMAGGVALSARATADVELTIENSSEFARASEPVTTGVPFPKGAVQDVGRLSAHYRGRPFPAQFTLLSSWEDGSVRWALLDMQGTFPAGGKETIAVRADGAGPRPPSPVVVNDGEGKIKVSTGPLEFAVDKKAFTLFSSVKVDGRELIDGSGRGLVITMPDDKTHAAGAVDEVALEHAGPMKTIVRVRGKFPDIHNGLLQYTVRITAYAGQKHLKVHAWLENQGAYGYARKTEWLNFKGMHIDLGLNLGGTIAAACEGATARNALRVEQRCDGQHRFADFKYVVTSGDKELKTGDRTDGVVALKGTDGTLNVALRHFWQQYEKAIELDGAALKLWLWPLGGEWPRQARRGDACSEFKQFRKAGQYALPGGVHKGCEIMLDFSGRSAEASAAALNRPLMALATPHYYASTLAAPGWFAPIAFRTGDATRDAQIEAWNRMAVSGVDADSKGSIVHARRGAGERYGFWYGWMDFGDLSWASGSSSLHYDWTWIMLLNFLRSGDRRFMDMGTEMARHRIDVDQIWSDRVQAAFRGLTRYEKAYTDIHGGAKGGYYKPITSHHWSSGVALYYMLTGEEKAKECALRSANGVVWREVNRYRDKPGSGGQPRSSGWGILVLCSAYDLTGDRKWLDEALILWNNNLKLKWKEKNDPTYGVGGGSLQYFYTLYPLIQLHDRTGNEDVFEFLKLGAEAGAWGPKHIEVNHFTDFYAYLGWKTDNEAYMQKAREALAGALRGQSNPPCYGGGRAWSKESAKKLRYGHLLHYIEWIKANP